MDANKIAVVKFGGTSVADERARTCAIARISEYRRAGYSLAVIVSAMGRMGAPYATDTLLSLVRGEDTLPETRDLIMSCGETISACVFADALCKEGVPAVPFTGATAGIQTDGIHLAAEVTGMDTRRVLQALAAGNVAVITGFQGISETGAVTTLGRGGSDTSAVCVAGYLGADETVIYTDVPGVAECDPRVVPEARFLGEIDCDDMLLLARLGAGVVHPRAIEAGKRFSMPVWVRSTFESTQGTKISALGNKPEGFVGIAMKRRGESDAVSMVYRDAARVAGRVAELFPGAPVGAAGDAVSVTLPGAEAAAAARTLYAAFAR
ncbi:MAG TPA: aspartate kinase [Clostridia bacterium]|nr:aspartate kinase [Clostridia bacterium]